MSWANFWNSDVIINVTVHPSIIMGGIVLAGLAYGLYREMKNA